MGNGDEGLAADRHHCLGNLVFRVWRLLWNRFVEDAVAPYAQDLKICSAIEQYGDDFWQANARNSEELSEKLQAN